MRTPLRLLTVAVLTAAMEMMTPSSAGISVPATHPPVTAMRLPTHPALTSQATITPSLAPGLADLANRVAPALVDILATQSNGQPSVGTGIVLTPGGLVLTNQHVIADASSIRATSHGNGNGYRAVLVGSDSPNDLALIQMQDASGMRPAELGNSDSVRVSDQVASIGNGYGEGLGIGIGPVTRLHLTIAVGNARQMDGMIEARTDLRPGASGGAMVTTDGQVIGVNTSCGVAPDTETLTGYGYAIPINRAMQVVSQLLTANHR